MVSRVTEVFRVVSYRSDVGEGDPPNYIVAECLELPVSARGHDLATSFEKVERGIISHMVSSRQHGAAAYTPNDQILWGGLVELGETPRSVRTPSIDGLDFSVEIRFYDKSHVTIPAETRAKG
ncbi:MAG: hypothetical protein KJ718_02525 [Nanoarchaeota archaeon]|nr:hypothetical protein [Nanoarchaeota archaeon]MBU1051405.1 hypothetical protein [Nanoarchaeota archaeon]MBU1989020.1 hypothetical protein [Nanoarchaeota archaeon]